MHQNYNEYLAEMYISLSLLVILTYLGLRFMVKLVHGDYKKKEKIPKTGLEADYVWRRVKVIYITVSTLIVLMVTGGAYNSSVQPPFYYRPSLIRGYLALFIGFAVAWVIYKLILPNIYNYLKKPSS